MKFDDILENVGGFSRFQFLTLSILCHPRAILPLHFLLHNFISDTPPHRCDSRTTEKDEQMMFHHQVLQQNNGSIDSCRINDIQGGNGTVPRPHGWIYDQSQFSSTTATEVSVKLIFETAKRTNKPVFILKNSSCIYVFLPRLYLFMNVCVSV